MLVLVLALDRPLSFARGSCAVGALHSGNLGCLSSDHLITRTESSHATFRMRERVVYNKVKTMIAASATRSGFASSWLDAPARHLLVQPSLKLIWNAIEKKCTTFAAAAGIKMEASTKNSKRTWRVRYCLPRQVLPSPSAGDRLINCLPAGLPYYLFRSSLLQVGTL